LYLKHWQVIAILQSKGRLSKKENTSLNAALEKPPVLMATNQLGIYPELMAQMKKRRSSDLAKKLQVRKQLLLQNMMV